MSRLFISHSSKDNAAAIAFKQWLGASGWPQEDVYLDLDSIGAGERWKESLNKANARCEAVVLLASPDALASPECLAEVRKAEDAGKEIIVVLLHDLQFDDRRLDSYKDRQIVDLAAPPQAHIETIDYRGERLAVHFNADGLARVKDFLVRRGITPDRFAWPPQDKPDADPFPGLSAFTENDAGIFFGRDADTVRGLDRLRILRRNGRPRLLVIQAASGAGKSSYLRAGLWPRLDRDPDFAPLAVLRPAQGILTGPGGLGRQLAARLSRPGAPVSPGDIHARLMAADPAAAAVEFSRLITMAATQALERRRIGNRDARAPALVIAVDQAEELIGTDDKAESDRFLFLLADLLREPAAGLDLFCLFTIRSDEAARLFQTVADLNLDIPETLPLLPIPQTAYRDVILKPLDVLARRGQRLSVSPTLVDRLVADATGADALPLLAFTISHLYREFGATGALTLEQYEMLGGVGGSIEMALKQALARPGDAPAIPAAKEDQLAQLRAAFIPWLARVDPETGAPMRRVAQLNEFPQGARAMVERLVAARLLVADRRAGADVVEVAHESLLRQWPALTAWLQTDADDLKLVDAIDRAASEWARNDRQDGWLDHRSERLAAGERVATREDFRKRLGATGVDYLTACRARELSQRRTARRIHALIYVLLVGIIVGLVGWIEQGYVKAQWRWYTVTLPYVISQVRPHVLTAAQEQALKPGDAFKECATNCPEMIVVPAGSFVMGSPPSEPGRYDNEGPQHKVTIAHPFAVAKFDVTFDEWDACAKFGDCAADIEDSTFGRGQEPVSNVNWYDAQRYVAWLSKVTGRTYRLLTEAEYEYAARAGTQTAYPWGDDVKLNGKAMADCNGCGSEWDMKQGAPVGSFAPNHFGLYDVVGNVMQWVEDCAHRDYDGAPSDGSAWIEGGNCTVRMARGGSWAAFANQIRSADRAAGSVTMRAAVAGFRVGRTLSP